jgi:hypothetical protein
VPATNPAEPAPRPPTPGVGAGTRGEIVEYGPDRLAHGPNPPTPSFGANRITIDTIERRDHWNKGDTLGLRQQAYIVAGQYHRVKQERGDPPT